MQWCSIKPRRVEGVEPRWRACVGLSKSVEPPARLSKSRGKSGRYTRPNLPVGYIIFAARNKQQTRKRCLSAIFLIGLPPMYHVVPTLLHLYALPINIEKKRTHTHTHTHTHTSATSHLSISIGQLVSAANAHIKTPHTRARARAAADHT